MKVVEELREAIEKYQAIAKSKEVVNSEEASIKLLRQRLVAKTKTFATLTFNVKDVFTPKIALASTKPIAIYESRPFRKIFKRLIYVETDAPAFLFFTLDGDIDKFTDLKAVIYNRESKIEMNKERREGFIRLNKVGVRHFHALIEGAPKRVDSDIQASVLLGIELKIIE